MSSNLEVRGTKALINERPMVLLRVSSRGGSSVEFSIWLELDEAQEMCAKLSALVREEIENATP